MGIQRVAFIGSKDIGLTILKEMHSHASETLVGAITIDDSNDSRSAYAEFDRFAMTKGINLRVASRNRHAEELLAELQPELCIVAGWYWLISDKTLNTVPHGFIGIHNSLLPKLRGAAPLVWTLIRGEKEAGVSMFSFTPGMDDGPIWAQASVPVEPTDYVADVLAKLEKRTIDMFRETYPAILTGEATPAEQDHSLATYCAPRTSKDGNIDWQQPAQQVYNFIRAQSSPYPGAFTYFEGGWLTVCRARIFPHQYCGTPGQVARITDDGVYVICGDHTAIILEEVQLQQRPGHKPQLAKEVITTIKCRFSRFLEDDKWDDIYGGIANELGHLSSRK